ncbi:MAG: ArsR family transcriptional regulator [Candidatus Shapirobacteria bacterium]
MALIKLILNNELCVNDIKNCLNLAQPKVSMLLKELRDLKLILSRVDGKKRYYSVNRPVINQYLIGIKKIISDFESNGSDEIIVRRI